MLPSCRVLPMKTPPSAASLLNKLLRQWPPAMQAALTTFLKMPSTNTSTDADRDQAWAELVQSEPLISRKPASELVRPSGSVTVPIALLLHYPPMTTAFRHNGEVLDVSATCTAMLFEKGITRNAFMHEMCHRRLSLCEQKGGERRRSWDKNGQSQAFINRHTKYRKDTSNMLHGMSTPCVAGNSSYAW